jgi:hypothetical protein
MSAKVLAFSALVGTAAAYAPSMVRISQSFFIHNYMGTSLAITTSPFFAL